MYLIEEPENGIQSRAVETMYQSLSNVYGAQVLLATHSPVIFSLVEPEHLLCFAKTADGATDIVLGSRAPSLHDWRGETNLATLFAAGVLDEWRRAQPTARPRRAGRGYGHGADDGSTPLPDGRARDPDTRLGPLSASERTTEAVARELTEFLRSFSRRYRYALVMFDREGCGKEDRSRDELESDMELKLQNSGSPDRSAVVVIDPELEVWLWTDSSQLDQVAGWAGASPSLRQSIVGAGFNIGERQASPAEGCVQGCPETRAEAPVPGAVRTAG